MNLLFLYVFRSSKVASFW